ncbi:uncharacterized protein E0L32_003795 [Thyridium curvatum]|uniref:Ecp2 effector protein-like domain-containing protein n=1 Tax=Thyridium curvatum TaxID=1093900 RepID=A0A507BHM8_9PEZI|nr:uncharacterized protein E0L32_003795 [Thyridium curvatum]TPX16501.1 hypothetical protein E0L32_003795 [Thyridium curvatum]
MSPILKYAGLALALLGALSSAAPGRAHVDNHLALQPATTQGDALYHTTVHHSIDPAMPTPAATIPAINGDAKPVKVARYIDFGTRGNNKQCSEETFPMKLPLNDAPLARDCNNLAASLATRSGYFTISSSEFGSNNDLWVSVVSLGTCEFALSLMGLDESTPILVGTTDIQYFIRRTTSGSDQGVVHASGETECNASDNGNEKFSVAWAVRSATSTKIAPRSIDFHASKDDGYCGETQPKVDSNAGAPLADDCRQLANMVASVPGYYSISADEFGAAGHWVPVVAKGTCAFGLRFQNSGDATTALVGTNDIRFYVEQVINDAKDGLIHAEGSILCTNGQKSNSMDWSLVAA